MEIFINERLVKRRAALGKYGSLLGLATLAGGLIASFYPQLFYVSLAALILGFLLSQLGSYNLQRWGRKPRADQVLSEALKGLDRKSRLYHYYLPAAHVLVSPTGLFVFTVKPQGGKVSCEGARWRQKLSFGRVLLFFGEEGLGNPAAELQYEMKQLAKFIFDRRPDLAKLSMRGAVVFSNPRVELNLQTPTVKVLQPKQLKAFVRGPEKAENQKYMKPEEREALIELFDEAVAKASANKKA
jgi:hypothetical protein